jgi:hypothetical protein
VLRGWNWKVVLAFLDDILVLEKDFEGHLANLRVVLVRYGLKLKPIKCEQLKQPVFGNKYCFGAVFGFDFHLPIC